jgi:teichuronic acid biosynthesis glycosyltransferase TuaG
LDNVLISVIIPTFNSGKFIKKAIESVYNQSYNNIELIIIDDGSSDNTIQVCEDCKKTENFSIIKNSHCGNIAYNRNLAAKTSKGDFLAFLDSDDVWENNKLEEQIKYVGEFNIICSNARIINENDHIIKEEYFSDFEENKELNLPDILKENYIITSAVLLKKEIFLKNGLFDESYGNLAEDYSLWLKIAEGNKIKFLNDTLILYRMHRENISFTEINKREDILMKTIRLRSNYLNNREELIRQSAKIGICKIHRELSVFYLYCSEFNKSCSSMIKSIKLCQHKMNCSFVNLTTYYLKIILLKIIGRLKY